MFLGILLKGAVMEYVHVTKVGVYSYWISGFGSAHCIGGFKDLISVG